MDAVWGEPGVIGGELAARMTAASYVGAAYTAAYRPSLNALQVYSSKGFLFVNKDLLQDAEFQAYIGTPTRLQTSAGAYTLSWAAPEDCCGLLGLARGGSKNVTFAELLSLISFGGEAVQMTGHIDVRRRHCLYLHSQALANLRALGPGGSRTVLARVPVDSVYGGLITRQHNGHVLDLQPCGGRTATAPAVYSRHAAVVQQLCTSRAKAIQQPCSCCAAAAAEREAWKKNRSWPAIEETAGLGDTLTHGHIHTQAHPHIDTRVTHTLTHIDTH